MPAAIGMGKGMEAVAGIHTEFLGRDEHRAGGAKADIAAAIAYGSGANGGSGIIACACADLHSIGKTQRLCHLGQKAADGLPAFKEPGHLGFAHAAEGEHFLAPALMLHIQQEHTGGIGIIAGMDTGEQIIDIILGQHDLLDLCKQLRLIFLHPKDLGSGEACKGDIAGEPGEIFLAKGVVQVVHLGGGAAVVPKDGGADHLIVLIQHHQAVHLTAAADACHPGGIEALQQLRDAGKHCFLPKLGVLLAPAGLGEFQGIFFRYLIADLALAVHKQKLCGRGAQIDTDIKHISPSKQRWCGCRGSGLQRGRAERRCDGRRNNPGQNRWGCRRGYRRTAPPYGACPAARW